MIDVGIVGVGTYLPEKTMKAAEIARLTNGVWSEDAVINKLGIKQRYLPGPDDGTQEMGAKAALKCLENTGVDPKEIDVILCIGEEWKEYPLTTSACYIQDRIGATNAWGIDVQNRCCTCVSAMKIAADMLRADDEINTIMICGGYRNGDFVDFTDKDMSMMYNLSAGGGAIILKKNYGKNLLLGSKIMSDGSLARTAGVEIGGMPIVGSLYSSPDEMGEDPVQVKPVSLAFAAKNFQATDALWKATIYVVNKPSQKDNEILINETMKQVCLNELDWSLANINMSDSPNFYQKGDDTIKNVVCPCAFTSGELDMVVPRYMVMENVNAVKNSKLLAYEKCGHSPLVDCPDRLIKDITEFFA